MKKLLTVLIALTMVFSGFAAEPVADVNTVDFSGWASTQFGVDLDSDMETGFKNETGVTFVMNFVPDDMTKSTEGAGVWGELVLLLDGSMMLEADDVPEGSSAVAVFDAIEVDVAKIHFNDIYVGVESGDFAYGDDFDFPHALNYGDDSDTLVGNNTLDDNNATSFAGYDQGFLVGYANDMVTFEASVRSAADTSGITYETIESVNIVEVTAADTTPVANIRYFALNDTDLETPLAAATLSVGDFVRKVVYNYDSIDYWTNAYALGAYVQATPMDGLMVGAGGSYAVSGSAEGDFSVFAGAQYKAMVTDMYYVMPVAAFEMYQAKGATKPASQDVGFGMNFGWGEAIDDSSLLEDMYEGKLAYNKGDDGDDDLLPGIAVYTNIDLATDMKVLPILVTAYTGDIVPNLGVAASFYTDVNDMDAMQIGVAGDYDIASGDLTLTPAAGVLYEADMIMPVVRFDVAGAIANTTFGFEWAGADFGAADKMGAITAKAKIEL